MNRSICLPLATALALVACTSQPQPPTVNVVVVVDRTDRHLVATLAEDASEVIASFRLDEDPWRGVDLRLAFVTDVGYNAVKELHLPAEEEADGNILVRRQHVRTFIEEVGELLRSCAAKRSERDSSLVYISLANELNLLARSKADVRLMIAYTDLLERAPGLSLYDVPIDSITLRSGSFIDHFERICPLERLDGIGIAIAAVPKSAVNSERITATYRLYEQMLTAKGALVFIGGNYVHHKQ